MIATDDLEVVGSLLDHEYEIKEARGRVIAEVTKKWISLVASWGYKLNVPG